MRLLSTTLVLTLLLGACGGGDDGASVGTDADAVEVGTAHTAASGDELPVMPAVADPPEGAPLPLAEVGAAFADPSTAEAAAWALAEHLGLGVYRADGTQVLAGSEQDVGDFWLYDFEIPALAAMSAQPVAPMSALGSLMEEAGVPVTAAELTDIYRAASLLYPDHPMVLVLRDTGYDFDAPDPELTALQQWLVVVGLLPAQGPASAESVAAGDGGELVLALAAGGALPGLAAEGDCPDPSGDGSAADFAIATSVANAAADSTLAPIVDELSANGSRAVSTAADVVGAVGKANAVTGRLKDFATMATFLGNLAIDLFVERPKIHKLHDGEEEAGPGTTSVTVRVTGKLPAGRIPCGRAKGYYGGGSHGLPNAGVRLTVDEALRGHVYVEQETVPARMITDDGGEVRALIHAQEEPGDIDYSPSVEEVKGMVRAEVDIAGALGDWFNPYNLLDIGFDLFDVLEREWPLTVEWHTPPAARAHGTMTSAGMVGEFYVWNCDGIEGHWQGRSVTRGNGVEIHVDVAFDIPEGSLSSGPVSHTVSLSGDVEGSTIRGDGTMTGAWQILDPGPAPRLSFTGSTTMTVTVSADGYTTPPQTQSGPVSSGQDVPITLGSVPECGTE